MLIKTASQSLTEQLCVRFADRIRNRLLAPGARFSSVRLCAEQQGVSVSTVVAAYDQLQSRLLCPGFMAKYAVCACWMVASSYKKHSEYAD